MLVDKCLHFIRFLRNFDLEAINCIHRAMNCTEVGSGQNVTTNTSNCTLRQEGGEGLYDVPAGIIALLSIFYGTISILAVVGNFLVMWIVATSRRMQNVTNCFISNLALADIVIGLFAIPFQFQAALLQRWNLPHFMCAFCPFIQMLSVNVSIFTLTAIAVDRHRAVLNPLSARPSKLRARLAIAGIWCLACALAAPMAAALRVTEQEDTDASGRVRTKPFCHNVNMSEVTMLAYSVLMVLVQYLTPLCIISCAYARMALRLWGSRAPGIAQESRDANLMKNKKKVIKMLIIVVALFALCWLPLQTYNVLQHIYPQINQYRYINIIWFCCDWLAMSNSCYNPFIYGIYNEKFKREFQQRFPFRSRGRSAHSQTIDSDFDKSQTLHTRVSVRLSYYSNSYDWRRSYSARAQQHAALLPHNNSFYHGVSVRGPLRNHNTSNNGGVTTELYVSSDKHHDHGTGSDMDELCL